MIRSKLAEVGARLEEAVANLPGEPADNREAYYRWEEMATQILDSTADLDPMELEEYLYSILYVKQQELNYFPCSADDAE